MRASARHAIAESLPADIQILWDREYVRREGLAGFAKLAMAQMEPRTKLKWGWALDAICQHLEAVSEGQITRLLMNVPPGTMKSLLASVLWPAYEWGPLGMPHLQYVTTSHSSDLTSRDSRKMRNLVTSQWFQDRWPVAMARQGEASFENKDGGFRESSSMKSLTGKRGHRVIVDDPHSTETAESEAERKRTIRTWREAIPTRVNDPETDAIVVIMQRLHVGDVSGDILADNKLAEDDFEKYVHLCLPMEFEEARRCETYINGELFFRDPRTEEGELLFPERFTARVVKRDKRKLGSVGWAGQGQQRPSPREGNIVMVEWLDERYARRGAEPLRILQSWDTGSKDGSGNDPSACLTAAEFPDRIELWDYRARRVQFPSLVVFCKDQYAARWEGKQPNIVLIEDKDSGQQLIQTLRADKDSKLPVKAINPGNVAKELRLAAVTPDLEAGLVRLPIEADWVKDFVDELTQIPNTPHDESGDCLSQLLKYIRDNPAAPETYGMLNVAGKSSSRMEAE